MSCNCHQCKDRDEKETGDFFWQIMRPIYLELRQTEEDVCNEMTRIAHAGRRQ